jgi:hypothetical protein
MPATASTVNARFTGARITAAAHAATPVHSDSIDNQPSTTTSLPVVKKRLAT